jgi:hypothetical protein
MEQIIENFASIDELVRVLGHRKPNSVFSGGSLSSDTGSESFTETKSYEDAVKLMLNGYEKPLAKIKQGVEANTRKFESQRTTPKNDIVGYAPCVPNAILGIPQSMINKEVIAKKSKILTLVYDIDSNAGTDADTFINAGVTVLSILNAMENDGYRVSLRVLFNNSYDSSQEVFSSVTLKDWRQPIDLKKMAFPFCHPSMCRRIGFRWLECHPRLTDRGFRSGYGRSHASMKDYSECEKYLRDNKLIKEHEKYINIKVCQKNDFDPHKVAVECGLK